MASLTEQSPVFIVSAPRTGSSWLAGTLARHSDINVRGHTAHDNYNLYLSRPVRSLNPFADDTAGSGPRWVECLQLRWLRHRYRRKQSAAVLVVATPTAAVYLPLLVRAFPSARFVHLTRDPLDQVASSKGYLSWVAGDSSFAIIRRTWATSPLRALLAVGGRWFHRWRWMRFTHEGFLVARPRAFQEAARHSKLDFLCWYLAATEAQIQETLAALPASRKHSCRYESLVSDSRELERLAHFLGVTLTREFLDDFRSSTHSLGVGRHKEVLDHTEIALIRRCLADSEFNPTDSP